MVCVLQRNGPSTRLSEERLSLQSQAFVADRTIARIANAGSGAAILMTMLETPTVPDSCSSPSALSVLVAEVCEKQLLAVADAALYQAKSAGRNRAAVL